MRLWMIVGLVMASPAIAAAQKHCEQSRRPDPLPMTMQLLDSVALATAIGRTSVPPTTFSLWYDVRGQLTHVLALADTMVARGAARPDSGALVRSQLARAISTSAFAVDSGPPVSLRLTIAHDSDGALHLSLARSLTCTPELIHTDGPRLVGTATAIVSAPAGSVPSLGALQAMGGMDRHAAANVVVDATGTAAGVLLTRSSGDAGSDESFQAALRAGEYHPGTIDGFPVAMLLEITSDAPALRR